MSQAEAQQFFSTFFGGADPFGGGGGFRAGGPGIRMNSFGGRSGAADPISMMFSQGGMSGMGGMHGAQFGGMPGGHAGFGGMPGGFGGMPGRKPPPPPPRYDAIPSDTIVSLTGLVGAADRNGDRGVIKSYIPQSGRYVVELEDSDETMSVKPSNILQHVGVRVQGIESQPQLNGKTGTVIAWNKANERYSIYVMALKKIVSLKPTNVILQNGTVGQVTGLSSKPGLNGKWGTIQEWISDTNKYDIQLSGDKIIRIKVENVRV